MLKLTMLGMKHIDLGQLLRHKATIMEIMRRLNYVLGPLIALLVMVYFTYHIVQGERGLFSWMRLRQKIAESEQQLAEIQAEKESLERQVYLLRPESLDPDMLEERARKVLNFARPEEVIIYDDPVASPALKATREEKEKAHK
jgi:cell division protein FtsB